MDPVRDAQVGFSRAEMHSKPLAGQSEPPSQRHLFCVTKTRAEEWPKDVSPVLAELQVAVGKGGVRVTAVEAIPGKDEEGDVLVFPDFIRLRGVLKSEEDIEKLVSRLKSEDQLSGDDVSQLDIAQVMVCAHTQRDERCGYCAPPIVEAFAKAPNANVCDVRKCSHIGGHVYAGNVIVFRHPGNSPVRASGSGGDWFGYVSPSDVPALLTLCESNASTYPSHELHHLWRGMFGIKPADHVDLHSRVSAACSSCTASVRDIEDGVAGYPSPTVNDSTRRQFVSPMKKAPAAEAVAQSAAADQQPLGCARVLFILGAPGSGKGTQCANLVRDYDLIHLSAGDLLRDERANPSSEDGQLIESYIRDGKIVPVAITVRLLWAAMTKHMRNGRMNFLIDGFPRNQDNLEGWEAQIGPEKARVVGVLFLDCAESIVEQRLLERGKTSGRIDDNISSIRKRFATFSNETMPIVRIYEKKRQCWHIDSARQKDDVYVDVRKVVDEFVIPTKRSVIFVLGGPGAGKGTQCSNLIRDFDCTHLSAGDLLRAERNNPESKDGQLIESYIVEGKIVPVEITVNLLLRAMKASGSRNFLIDGFPRNVDNMQGWEKVVGADPTFTVAGVLFFDVPEEVMEKRLLERAAKDGANARSDDNIEVIRKRFKTFRDETMPIVNHYKQKNLVWFIGADRPVEVVYEQVHSLAEEVFLPALEIPKRKLSAVLNKDKEKTPVTSGSSKEKSTVSGQVRFKVMSGNATKLIAVVSIFAMITILKIRA